MCNNYAMKSGITHYLFVLSLSNKSKCNELLSGTHLKCLWTSSGESICFKMNSATPILSDFSDKF